MNYNKLAIDVLQNGSPIALALSQKIYDFRFRIIPTHFDPSVDSVTGFTLGESNKKLAKFLNDRYSEKYIITSEDYIIKPDEVKVSQFIKYKFKYNYCFIQSSIKNMDYVISKSSRYPFVAYVHDGDLLKGKHRSIACVIIGICDETAYLVGIRRGVD